MNGEPSQYGPLPGMDFGEAVGRLIATDPRELVAVAGEAMKDDAIEQLIAAFEEAAQADEAGEQYWLARDLARLLEYSQWRNFLAVVARAKEACAQAGHDCADHFADVSKMVSVGSGANRGIDDVELSRYAAYLIAQNGDPRKKPVAFAQTYFAIQTRRQELQDRSEGIAVPQSEDEKRVYLRNQIKEHNRYLSSAAKNAGVISPQDFAIFHSQGYQGLYGRNVAQIRQHRGLPPSADILDRMGSTELAANFFRVTQTEEKLRREEVKGKEKAFKTHYAVGRQVRDAMLKISGVAPEDLPPADSIKAAEKRISGQGSERLLPATRSSEIARSQAAQSDQETVADMKPISLRADLWKYALLVIVNNPNMEISTSDLINKLPNYVRIPADSIANNSSRSDSKFSQIVRNLKSHKTSGNNFIFLGYAEDIKGGFRATEKGRQFVITYFGDSLR